MRNFVWRFSCLVIQWAALVAINALRSFVKRPPWLPQPGHPSTPPLMGVWRLRRLLTVCLVVCGLVTVPVTSQAWRLPGTPPLLGFRVD